MNITNIISSKENSQVYYSTNSNEDINSENWSTESIEAKSYKIIIENIQPQEVIAISYSVNIPENLDYCLSGKVIQNVNYTYQEQNLNKESIFTLKTPEALSDNEEAYGPV